MPQIDPSPGSSLNVCSGCAVPNPGSFMDHRKTPFQVQLVRSSGWVRQPALGLRVGLSFLVWRRDWESRIVQRARGIHGHRMRRESEIIHRHEIQMAHGWTDETATYGKSIHRLIPKSPQPLPGVDHFNSHSGADLISRTDGRRRSTGSQVRASLHLLPHPSSRPPGFPSSSTWLSFLDKEQKAML